MKKLFYFLSLVICSAPGLLNAQERLRLATTTSTDNSGLLAELHPVFETNFDVKVDVIAVGTGKALRLGENGDVDVVMVHAPAAEISFVDKGHGVERLSVMHNDFVILGPQDDPAGLGGATTLNEALQRLHDSGSSFVSRGDDSGTHKKEMSLWRAAGETPSGIWYLAVGQGMGAVIQIANDKQAYTLSDRGTYLAHKDKIALIPVFQGDPELFNPYHVIIVNPVKHPHVKTGLAQKYVDFIRGESGQKIIREFKKAGEILFKPDVIRH
jgi:tungstate transport system substrate-binding protein